MSQIKSSGDASTTPRKKTPDEAAKSSPKTNGALEKSKTVLGKKPSAPLSKQPGRSNSKLKAAPPPAGGKPSGM